MAEKKYINSLYVKTGKYGLRVSGKVEDICKELQQHANDRGYINLDINERKTPSDKGITHSVVLDEWEPENKGY